MMQRSSDESPAVIPIPQHPGLALLCTAPERYPPAMIARLVGQIEQWAAVEGGTPPGTSPVIAVGQVKELLRRIHEPHRLAAHPLAARCGAITPAQRGTALAQFLTTAIAALEHPSAQVEQYLPGTILRMRYLECTRAKQIIRHLHLSERHYYRLQLLGLQHLAAQLDLYLWQGA